MPSEAEQVQWARQLLRSKYAGLVSLLNCKLTLDYNPCTEELMAEDEDLNKSLVKKMEEVRDDDFFVYLVVSGSDEKFMRGWKALEEHRRRWELPYYEKYTDAQWREQYDDIQEIYNLIKNATLY